MIIRFRELVSTNSYLKENCEDKPQFTVVTADFQSAGRGQRGNSWESEPDKNLLMSLLYRPTVAIHPTCQFRISKAVALATVEVLEALLAEVAHPEVCIKWPNDIYIGNGKVAGILIENALAGADRIAHSVVGIGLNVNQSIFRSDAPNPVSLINYLGAETNMEDLTRQLRDRISSRLLEAEVSVGEIDELYKSHLWRRTGFHPYVALVASAAPAPTAISSSKFEGDSASDVNSDILEIGKPFEAEIVDVAGDGRISMRLRSGSIHSFYFKEVTPVLQ